jgi:hypothetical protein
MDPEDRFMVKKSFFLQKTIKDKKVKTKYKMLTHSTHSRFNTEPDSGYKKKPRSLKEIGFNLNSRYQVKLPGILA